MGMEGLEGLEGLPDLTSTAVAPPPGVANRVTAEAWVTNDRADLAPSPPSLKNMTSCFILPACSCIDWATAADSSTNAAFCWVTWSIWLRDRFKKTAQHA